MPTTDRSFYPEIREALIMILRLGKNPPPCPKYLVDIAQNLLPELQGKTRLTRERCYTNFKQRLKRVYAQLCPFYGPYPESEANRWQNPEDRKVISLIREKWQLHQMQLQLRTFMENRPSKTYLKEKLEREGEPAEQ